jgi:hypothetical protein
MSLEQHLKDKKKVILSKWFDLTIETYPDQTAQFLKSKKNQFANPVGYTVFKEIEPILDGLCNRVDCNTLQPFLENIIRIRAIQDFSPSQAISFVFLLKQVIREEMEVEIQRGAMGRELLDLESRIDELGLLSFNIFMKCREKIYDLKANELKNRTVRLLKRAKVISEEPEENLKQ